MNEKDKSISRTMRISSFVAGIGFLGLGVVDATFNPFPGTEKFFCGTGIALMALGLTGKQQKTEKE